MKRVYTIGIAVIVALVAVYEGFIAGYKEKDTANKEDLVARIDSLRVGEPALVAFWNVENYFDPFKDTLTHTQDGDFTPSGSYHWTWRRFVEKRNMLAKTIIAMDYPLVLGLCEVENRFVLRQLTKETPLAATPYRIVHRDSPDRRGIDVALLCREDRVRVLSSRFYRIRTKDGKDFLQSREILYAKTLIDQCDTVHFLVNHWPSMRNGAAGEVNRNQAFKTLRHVTDSVLRRNPQARIVAMGDFNSQVASWPTMQNVSAKPSYKYRGEWNILDQFLVSPALQTTLEEVDVFKFPFLLEADDTHMGDKPYRTYLGPRYHGGVSDHLPIRLIFTTFAPNGR